MSIVRLEVAGTPRARPRPRHGARIGKNKKAFSFSYQPNRITINKKTGKPDSYSVAWVAANVWYAAVRDAVKPILPAEPWEGPVWCSIDVYFERPEWLNRKSSPPGPVFHISTPDRDNLEKSVTDALKEAGMFRDDSQVCAGRGVRKWYAAKGCGPGVVIRLRQIDDGVKRPARAKKKGEAA